MFFQILNSYIYTQKEQSWPSNISELQSFLGSGNYYQHFLKHFAQFLINPDVDNEYESPFCI